MLTEKTLLQARLVYMHQQLEVYSILQKLFFQANEAELSKKYSKKKCELKRQIAIKLDLLFETDNL